MTNIKYLLALLVFFACTCVAQGACLYCLRRPKTDSLEREPESAEAENDENIKKFAQKEVHPSLADKTAGVLYQQFENAFTISRDGSVTCDLEKINDVKSGNNYAIVFDKVINPKKGRKGTKGTAKKTETNGFYVQTEYTAAQKALTLLQAIRVALAKEIDGKEKVNTKSKPKSNTKSSKKPDYSHEKKTFEEVNKKCGQLEKIVGAYKPLKKQH